ncbi:MAG: hypothetical protein Wins2KO_05400 [Winogradskyella sp.]
MKKTVNKILVVALMLGTLSAGANTRFDGGVSKNSKLINKGSHIIITDHNGTVLYSGELKTSNDLTKIYDFSHLKNGIYLIEISKGYEIELTSIEVKNQMVKHLPESKTKLFKPVVRTEENKIIISKIATDSKAMWVKLYFEDELIYEDTIKGDAVLNRVYQLDNIKRGSYTAVITSDERVYKENFEI